jgi:peptide/nickel transport system ATP-binding protein
MSGPGQSPLLAIRDLHVTVAGRHTAQPVLRGVNLAVHAGEVHGLVGESGAGKSMIGRAIFGLLPGGARVTRGGILFEGEDLAHMPPAALRALLGVRIAFIPQDPTTSLNPVRRIGDQIGAVLRHRLGLARGSIRERIFALLGEVAIRDPGRVIDLYPHEISGGMRQRILIATAFAARPHLVVADEPTTALDVTVQRQILRLIHDLQHKQGAAVLFVTHDLALVAKLCQTVTVLHGGRVLESGATATVLADPQHPYTRALLSATPRLDRPAEALAPMPRELLATLAAEARAYDAANPAYYRAR